MKRVISVVFLFILLSVRICVADEALISDLYKNKKSDVQVSGSGVVVKVLPDDNDGIRHQKFILRLENGITLLVAHNIDLAPRLESLIESEIVEFNGEYEWNSKGGVIHWTHRDPNNRHIGGWLVYRGRKYQ